MSRPYLTRRDWLNTACATAAAALSRAPDIATASTPAGDLEIGSRREMFVDRFLVDTLRGLQLKLFEPRPAPIMSEPANQARVRNGDQGRQPMPTLHARCERSKV